LFGLLALPKSDALALAPAQKNDFFHFWKKSFFASHFRTTSFFVRGVVSFENRVFAIFKKTYSHRWWECNFFLKKNAVSCLNTQNCREKLNNLVVRTRLALRSPMFGEKKQKQKKPKFPCFC